MQHAHHQAETDTGDADAPKEHQRVQRRRHRAERAQEDEGGKQQRDRSAKENRRQAAVEVGKKDACHHAGETKNEQQRGGRAFAQRAEMASERLDVAVGGEMRGDDDGGKSVEAKQARAARQQRQTAQRAGITAGQTRQERVNGAHHRGGDQGNQRKSRAPAERLPDEPPQRQTENRCHRAAHGNPADGLLSLAGWGKPHRQRRSNRPKNSVRQRHTGARSQQQGEIPGDGSCDMAHDKERKEGEQQAAPFAPRDEQHPRQ